MMPASHDEHSDTHIHSSPEQIGSSAGRTGVVGGEAEGQMVLHVRYGYATYDGYRIRHFVKELYIYKHPSHQC